MEIKILKPLPTKIRFIKIHNACIINQGIFDIKIDTSSVIFRQYLSKIYIQKFDSSTSTTKMQGFRL